MTIPSDFKAELDRICALFAKEERSLQELEIKAEFTIHILGMRYDMHFAKINGRFRIWYGDKPISDLTAVEKIEVAEKLYLFKDAYIKYLTELAARARKAGK